MWIAENITCSIKILIVNYGCSIFFYFWLKTPCVGCTHNNKTFWQFCEDSDEYDRTSPTKQNIQCDGRSAAKVIASSCDAELRQKIAIIPHDERIKSDNNEAVRNFVTLPSADHTNFVTLSPNKNKLRVNPKFGAARSLVSGDDSQNFSQISGEVSRSRDVQSGRRDFLKHKNRPLTINHNCVCLYCMQGNEVRRKTMKLIFLI